MEIIESVMWVLAGFVPTLVGMEIAWRTRASKVTSKIAAGIEVADDLEGRKTKEETVAIVS